MGHFYLCMEGHLKLHLQSLSEEKTLLPLGDEDFQELVLWSKELVYELMKEFRRQLV